jgi:hypothetical protein
MRSKKIFGGSKTRKDMRRLAFVLVSGILVVLSSCTTFQVSGLSMNSPASNQNTDYQILGNFETKVWVNKFLGMPAAGPTLFNLTSGASDGAIQRAILNEVQIRGGTGATNIKIKWSANILQLIANSFTFGLWSPATATISGMVIKAN